MKLKTLKVNQKIHEDLKNYCKNNMLKMNNLVEYIISEYLKIKNNDDKR